MKILRLSLNNLASLAGTQHIDFESAPLSHAGLIAITGKTGAGKSTLLDAMCLALYNEIPRLRGASGSLKDAGGQEISIKDSKNILRRGTVSGFSEIEFIALDGKRYQARWEIRRARNKIDGNLKVERTITYLDEHKILNQKISEATAIVEKLIGLNFEQFTRGVLLAQSEVGAFLKAKDHERADLLEYLTNSHIFSLVSIKAAEKYSQVKQQRAELENLMGNVADELLSPEHLKQLQHTQSLAKSVIEQQYQQEKQLDQQLKWHLDCQQLYTHMQSKKDAYLAQENAEQKLAVQKQLLTHLDQFQEIRESFLQQIQLNQQQNHVVAEQQKFALEFQTIQKHETTARQQFNQAQQQFDSHLAHIKHIKPYLEQGLKLDQKISILLEQHTLLKTRQQDYAQTYITPLENQLNELNLDIQQLEQDTHQSQLQLNSTADLAVFDQEPQSILQRLQEYQHIYQKMMQHTSFTQYTYHQLLQEESALQQHIQNLQQKFGDLTQLEQQLQHHYTTQQQQQTQKIQLEHLIEKSLQLTQKEQELQHLVQEIQTHQQDLKQFEITQSHAEQQLHTHENQLMQLEQILTQQRLLTNPSVSTLRDQLQPNEACMVCGSHQHPFVTHQEILSTALTQLHEQQLSPLQQQRQNSQTQLQNIKIQLSKTQIQLEQKQQHQQKLTHHIQHEKNLLTSTAQACHLVLDTMLNAEQRNSVLKQHATHLERICSSSTQQLDELKHSVQFWRTQQQQIHALQLKIQQHQQLESLIHPILAVLTEPQQHAWHASTLQTCLDLQEKIAHRLHYLTHTKYNQEKLQAQIQQQQQLQQQLKIHQQRSSAIQQELEDALQQGKSLRHDIVQLTTAHATTPYSTATEWQQQLEQQQHFLQKQLQQHRQITEQHHHALQHAQLQQNSLNTQIQHLSQTIKICAHTIEQWQNQYPDFSQDMIKKCLDISHLQHQNIRQQLHTQQQAVEHAKSAWKTLEDQYQRHLQQKPQLTYLEVEQALSKLLIEKAQQQQYVDELNTQIRVNTNHANTYQKYQTHIEKIKTEEYRWGRIYDLIGHKEGSKFQKIAQEHHLDILVEYANQQLQPLTPRYQLHRIANSLSLAIIDLDMNNEVRPVLSLSGGETFLVSLALALAIANMASGSMKLESLFIDEGFGTLDPASLHLVMNALDHLQSQGRKVVLISHIQDMHERIPVQIQVNTLGSGASRITIVG